MAKQINFEYQGEHYTLEFSRRTVQEMERSGFNINKVIDAPLTGVEMLFNGAFLMHHRRIKQEKINEIYRVLTNKQELVEKLIVLYNEPLSSLMDEPEGNEGNAQSWTANW